MLFYQKTFSIIKRQESIVNGRGDSFRKNLEVLSLVLQQKVKILSVLPNDSTRIADEHSLVITDIVIELEDHSIANVEVQKLGYRFPGQRCACYSADLLLRQYKKKIISITFPSSQIPGSTWICSRNMP